VASTLLCVSFRPWSIIVACLGIDENSRRKFNKNIQPHQKRPHFFSRNLRLFSPNCGRFAVEGIEGEDMFVAILHLLYMRGGQDKKEMIQKNICDIFLRTSQIVYVYFSFAF